ncbi:MAG: segregation and condensation protein A [Thermodesulfobacteriota bacterium]
MENIEKVDACMVKLEGFEGPLDLLLHLIKRNELDIYDIPVALITEQYLEYLNMMKELNLEIVGDYLIIAAELGHIKSKMLLPEPPIEEEEEDPRASLVRRLLEYQKFKDAASELSSFETLEKDVFIRTPGEDEVDQDSPLFKVDLWSLIDSLREIYARRSFNWSEGILFELDNVTVEQRVEEIRLILKTRGSLNFEELFGESISKSEIIVTFLAILELMRIQMIGAFQELPYSQIKLIYLGDDRSWTESY